jgi:hypothetical protein
MDRVESNLRDVETYLDRLAHAADFDGPSFAGAATFGDEIADFVAADTRDRALGTEAGPDGERWDPLKPETVRRKGSDQPGVDTGEMLSPEHLGGERTIAADDLAITYGRSAAVRQRAEWFSDGTRHMPPRPFWGLDAEMERGIVARLAAHVEAAEREASGTYMASMGTYLGG